jgi:hypothetical protein
MAYGTPLDLWPLSYAAFPTAVGQAGTREGMTNVTSPGIPAADGVPWVTRATSHEGPTGGGRALDAGRTGVGQASDGPSPRGHASGRTTPRIGIVPAPASVTVRPGRGAWTIAPSPTYIATWLASLK